MSLTTQNLSRNTTYFHITLAKSHISKPHKFLFLPPNSNTHLPNHHFFSTRHHVLPIISKVKASAEESYSFEQYESTQKENTVISSEFDFDAFLSVLEFLCLASSALISVYVAVSFRTAQKGFNVGLLSSNVLLSWQCVVLVCGVVVGTVIRRRQWSRIRGFGLRRGSGSGVDLLGRVEKVEEDMRASATMIRVLSRQLEKLGIRFRVTRKALKGPIAETAALAQKNSEATRALAAQEDILEKELGEIQKVLLAMQEQQQKQLELILAVGKNGKLFENKRVTTKEHNPSGTSSSAVDGVPHLEKNQIPNMAMQKESNNDRA